MKFTKIFFALFIAIIAILLKENVMTGQDIIKIGFEGPLSGLLGHLGKSSLDGIKLAIKEINEKSGILNKKVELYVFDDSCEMDKAKYAWDNFFKKNGVDLVLGNLCGENFSIAAGLAARDNKILVSSGLSGPWLISDVKNPWSFPLGLGFHAQTEALNKYLKDQNISDVGLIVSEQKTAIYAHDFFVSEARSKGVNIRATIYFGPGTTTKLQTIILPLKRINSQGILIISDLADVGSVVKASAEIGLRPQIIGAIVTDNRDFTGINLRTLEGVVFPYNFTYTTKEGKDFVSNFRKEYAYAPYFSAKTAYDLMYLFKKAIERTGSADSKKLTKTLEGFSFDTGFGKLVVDRDTNKLFYRDAFMVTPKKGELVLRLIKIKKGVSP